MIKYINGDIHDVIKTLEDNSIDFIYTDPPFTYELLRYEKPKYHYSWRKNNSTGFLSSKYQPLRQMEEIFIYYKKSGTYNPQMVGTKIFKKRNVKYGGKNGYWGEDGINKQNEYNKDEGHVGTYPTTFKEWDIRKDNSGITRTDEQIDYFIKTYSNETDTILDMTCCNKYVGNRCEILNRNYIGVDIREII